MYHAGLSSSKRMNSMLALITMMIWMDTTNSKNIKQRYLAGAGAMDNGKTPSVIVSAR